MRSAYYGTVTLVSPITPEIPNARMVASPEITAVTRPLLAGKLLTLATFCLNESQVTWWVRSCVVPSEYVPVAVYCCEAPTAKVCAAGVTAIDTKLAEVTVKVVDAVTDPSAAVIVAVPADNVTAWPFVANVFPTITVLFADEDQVTLFVTSWVEASE